MYGNPLGVAHHRDREALANLLDCLEIAEEAARVLALHRHNPQWIIVANQFGRLRDTCARLAQ